MSAPVPRSVYPWLVLAVASAGWVFDVYEGQIFNITRNQLLADVLKKPAGHPDVRYYGEVLLGVFLAGGAVGGVGFGVLADRWGRRRTLIATIVTYSVFSGLTAFADSLWQVAALRFLVAVGTGGEWSVAAAMVAEVFPPAMRPYAGSVFHATSILGTWLAGLAGLAVGADWRTAFLLGVAPAVLVVFVRAWLKEPEIVAREAASGEPGPPSRDPSGPLSPVLGGEGRGEGAARPLAGGSSPHPGPPPAAHDPAAGLRDLVANPVWRTRAVLGLLLAAVGLGTFWAVTIEGQTLAREMLVRTGTPRAEAEERAKFAFGIVQTTGGGLGLLAFGPLSAWAGRRAAFVAMQFAALAVVPAVCFLPQTYGQLLAVLPVYGFFTLGIHAGFAVYFPELFPARIRATGAGLCFNGGRLVAASVLVFSAWLKGLPDMDPRFAVWLMSLLFVPGIVLACLLPETKGRPLPE